VYPPRIDFLCDLPFLLAIEAPKVTQISVLHVLAGNKARMQITAHACTAV